MRIGLFTDTYTPDINGVVTSIVTLKDALERQGHTVFVVTNQRSIINTSYEDQVLRLPGVELKFLYGYVMSGPMHLQGMRVIEDMDLDIIHVHSEFGIGMFARSVSKQFHVPLISTYHTTYEDYTHYVNLFGLKTVDSISKMAVAKMSRMFTKTAQVVIAPSEKTKKMLLGYDIKKEITVIPTGLDLQRFDERNPNMHGELEARYGLDDRPRFIYIGRLAKEKSIDVVIEGFAKLIHSGVKAHLLIVGGGPSADDYKEQVRKLNIENDVIFTGPVDSVAVVYHYHLADAFVSASLTETQGLTYIEALACGLCVFARPDKPLEGIIIEDETGYLFDDTDMFAEKAKLFIESDTATKNRLKHSALSLAQSFDSSVFATRMLEAYTRASELYHGRYRILSIEASEEPGQTCIGLESQGMKDMIVVDDFIVERKDLKVGDVVTRVELNELEDDQQLYSAYQYALQKIAIKDYTSFEIRQLLQSKMDLNSDKLDVVIDLLEKGRFIDDERYFRDKIEYHFEQKRGNYRIIEDLERRGFSHDKIQEALDAENYDDYIERGVQRSERYLGTLRDGSKRQRIDKLSDHLLRQGYDYHAIQEIVTHVDDPYEEQDEERSMKQAFDKAWNRYEKRYDDPKEVKNRVVRHIMSKGYDYDKLKELLEEKENGKDN